MELSEFKVLYKKLESKYKLPSFTDLNEKFEIDRIDRDTDTLLREIRKVMMEKVIGYIRFLEMMVNPASAPPMFMLFVKQVTETEKKTIERVYKACVELELKALKLEIDYDEKLEVEHIIETSKVWDSTRDDMRSVIGIMEKNWKSTGQKNGKGYFG